MTKRIIVAQLEAANACQEQIDLFERLFGNSVVLTEELVLEHYSSFDVEWAAECLLSSSAYAVYSLAATSAWAEYKKITDPAYEEYANGPRACCWAEYKKIEISALEEYKKACALAFYHLYKSS
jgi:hypothetical protein